MERFEEMFGIVKRFAHAAGVLSILVLCVIVPVQAKPLKGVTLEWAPHYGSELPNGGAMTVIVTEAFRRAGHPVSVEFIPWQRALKEVAEGEDDFVMGAYYSAERARTYLYSDPIYSVDLGLVALNSLTVPPIDDLSALTPFRIGVSRGFANTEAFDNADFLNKDFASSPKLNLRKLFRHRVDLIVGAFDIFRYQAKMENLDVAALHFIEPPLQSNDLYIMASRSNAAGQAMIDDFNKALRSMREDGTLGQLLKEYLNRN